MPNIPHSNGHCPPSWGSGRLHEYTEKLRTGFMRGHHDSSCDKLPEIICLKEVKLAWDHGFSLTECLAILLCIYDSTVNCGGSVGCRKFLVLCHPINKEGKTGRDQDPIPLSRLWLNDLTSLY